MRSRCLRPALGPSWCSGFRPGSHVGVRVGAVAGSAQDDSRSAADYEARKRPTTIPKPHAPLKGCSLVPLVAEACAGGWATAATCKPRWQHSQRFMDTIQKPAILANRKKKRKKVKRDVKTDLRWDERETTGAQGPLRVLSRGLCLLQRWWKC